MVREAKIDAVIVTTPHPLHKEHTIAALEAGAHVLVEKPMALTVSDCDEMIACAQRMGRKLATVSQRRWLPASARIKDAIEAGKLGVPMIGQVTILGWRDEAYYKSDPWRGKWESEGGGVVVNQASHQLDLLHWFLGPVKEVYAQWDNINHPYIEVDDTAVATVRFASGAMASILISNSQKPGIWAKVHVHGSSASSVGVQTDGGAMFIPGLSGVSEPPLNDLWTIKEKSRTLIDGRRRTPPSFTPSTRWPTSSGARSVLHRHHRGHHAPVPGRGWARDGEDHRRHLPEPEGGRADSLLRDVSPLFPFAGGVY